jgi:hypothetical protein
VGERTEDGVRPIAFADLEALAAEWAHYLPDTLPADGPVALLRTARSLFAYSWFDYEFMVVACLVGFQALEAAFRDLYPEASEKTPLRRLVDRAEREGFLPPNIADLAATGVELRNWLSHPATQAAFTLGIAASMLENTHRLVAVVLNARP